MRDRNSSRSCNRPFGLSCGGARLSLRSHAAKIEQTGFLVVAVSCANRQQTDRACASFQAMHPHAVACRVRKAWP